MAYPNGGIDPNTNPGDTLRAPLAAEAAGTVTTAPSTVANPDLPTFLSRVSSLLVALETLIGDPVSPATGSILAKLNLPPAGGGTKTFATFGALHGNPPAANNATFDTLNSIPVQDFPQTVLSSLFFVGALPQGATWTTGLKVNIKWLASVTGNVVWGAAFEQSEAQAVAADHWLTQVTAVGAAPATVNSIATTTIQIPTADLGSLAAEQAFRLQIQRIGTNGSDTLAGIAQLVSVTVEAY